MGANEITEGHWTYSRQGMGTNWTLTDSRTGQSHDTGARTFPDARRFSYDLGRTVAAATQWTIASGPERSRAGDQRYRKAFAA